MFRSMTETTSAKSWCGWTIVPSNSLPTVDVAPPSFAQNMFFMDPSARPGFGEFRVVVDALQKRAMDASTHERLLNESVHLYDGIWRDLAGR